MYYLNDNDRKLLKMTTGQEQFLKSLAIDDTGPGTILRDFEMLISLIQETPLELTPAHQLPLKTITVINSKLTNPIEHGLKRVSQKSFSQVHGLFLLVRASGLTEVILTKKGRVLKIADDLYSQWKTFNFYERYGNLLEAWFLRGREEILGERDGWRSIPDNFGRCVRLWSDCGGLGLIAKDKKGLLEYLRFYPALQNLGLMDLFGLIHIERGPMVPDQGWQIMRVSRTSLATALFPALSTLFFSPDL